MSTNGLFHLVIRGQLDATGWFFIEKLMVRSTCFGHHYAHHQALKSYTDGSCLWYLALPQAATICVTLELLMMGIMVPETC